MCVRVHAGVGVFAGSLQPFFHLLKVVENSADAESTEMRGSKKKRLKPDQIFLKH